MIETKEKREIEKPPKPKKSSIYKVGSLHYVTIKFETETEIIDEGTPMKIISVDDEAKTIKCKDYKGRDYQVDSYYLWEEEIKKYPNCFKIMLMKINNLFCQLYENVGGYNDFTEDKVRLALFNAAGLLLLIGLAFESLLVLIPVMFIILLFLLTFFLLENPLYTKENLKELKILFNQKGAKTGSEAITKDKGE